MFRTITVLIFMSIFNLYGVENSSSCDRFFKDKDSLRAEFMISCYSVELDSIQNTSIYKPLFMSEQDAIRTARKLLNRNNGRKFTSFKRPFFRYNLRGYWIVANAEPIRLRKGGGFTIVINSYNWAIVCLIYGK